MSLSLDTTSRLLSVQNFPVTPSSPIRYNITATRPQSANDPDSAVPGMGSTLISPHNAWLPPVDVTDLLDRKLKDRAVYWMVRCLVKDKSCSVAKSDIYARYHQSFSPHQDTHPLLLEEDLLQTTLKVFPDSSEELWSDGKTVVFERMRWKGVQAPWSQAALAEDQSRTAAQQTNTESVATDSASSTSATGQQSPGAPPFPDESLRRMRHSNAKSATVPIKSVYDFVGESGNEEGKIGSWARHTFISDVNHAIETTQIYEHYREEFELQQPLPDRLLQFKNVIVTVLKAFPSSEPVFYGASGYALLGLRWRRTYEVEDVHCATMIRPELQQCSAAYDFDEHFLVPSTVNVVRGRRLCHIPEPDRTRLWLEMFFERGENEELASTSLWQAYDYTYRPWGNQLDDVEFTRCVLKVFKGAEETEVSPDHFVLYGIRPRDEPQTASEMEKLYRKRQKNRQARQVEAMQRNDAGPSQPRAPLNLFAQKLLQDPLLSLGADQPSSWTLRLRARREGKPLGDEQTGFPGVSMKRVSRQYKRCLKSMEADRKTAIDRKQAENSVAVDDALEQLGKRLVNNQGKKGGQVAVTGTSNKVPADVQQSLERFEQAWPSRAASKEPATATKETTKQRRCNSV